LGKNDLVIRKIYWQLLIAAVILGTAGCTRAVTTPEPVPTATVVKVIPTVTTTATPEPVPPRVLSVCLGQEPGTLFLYGEATQAARAVRQAIYDGPLDIVGFEIQPVILEKLPRLADGDAFFEAVDLSVGDLYVNPAGELVKLEDGSLYLPPGCRQAECAATFAGEDTVRMEQLVARFALRPDIQWSDGVPLTAGDSQFSFEIAKALYPQARANLVRLTDSYRALDETTVEWRGLAGYQPPQYATFFFVPLPQHLWQGLDPAQMPTAEMSARAPLGWGPYVIDEWVAGDHITLSRNPRYFRAAEGLPVFDRLVYRFLRAENQALEALLAGECDLVDETVDLELRATELRALHQVGKLKVVYEVGTAWEHADFGIVPFGDEKPSLFQQAETRRALAACIDRQKMAGELFLGQTQVLDSYVPPQHPLYAAEAALPAFDPQMAAEMLEDIGWRDVDNDPATPRTAQGIPGIPDGAPFEFDYLVLDNGKQQQTARILQASLAQCGVKVNLDFRPREELFAAGEEGLVFGRQFDMAQFAWVTGLEPPCFLFTSAEIPGPYPEFPKGWGGANASGYSNPAFDQACQTARTTLPDFPAYQEAHRVAQLIFAEDVPVIPLYLHLKQVAIRPDMCGLRVDPSTDSVLWNLEVLDYGADCQE